MHERIVNRSSRNTASLAFCGAFRIAGTAIVARMRHDRHHDDQLDES